MQAQNIYNTIRMCFLAKTKLLIFSNISLWNIFFTSSVRKFENNIDVLASRCTHARRRAIGMQKSARDKIEQLDFLGEEERPSPEVVPSFVRPFRRA